LPPVQQGREFHSLDTAGDSESEKQPVEMGFHSAPRHLELSGNLGVITTLQKQFDDLLFARTQPNSLLHHPIPLFIYFLHYTRRFVGAQLKLSNSHSTRTATLRRILSLTVEQ
jgi:hypothetical protein